MKAEMRGGYALVARIDGPLPTGAVAGCIYAPAHKSTNDVFNPCDWTLESDELRRALF